MKTLDYLFFSIHAKQGQFLNLPAGGQLSGGREVEGGGATYKMVGFR